MHVSRSTLWFAAALWLAITFANTASQAQIIQNPEFDNSTHWWWPHGSGDIEPSADAYQSGNACLASNRTELWNGIAHSLNGDLEVGKDYHIVCYVKTVGVATGELQLEIHQNDDRGDVFFRVGAIEANDTEWTMLQGGFKLESNGSINNLYMVVNGTYNDPVKFDFLLDSVSVTENDWETDANLRIEQHRKRDVELNLADSNGIPIGNIQTDVQQIRHQFAFGSALNDLIADGNNTVYEDFFKEHFDWATIEWYSQWAHVEQVQDIEDYAFAQATYDFAAKHGIQVKGHAITWSTPTFLPTWLPALSDSEIEAELEARITNSVSQFNSKFAAWDVCNEALSNSFFADRLGEEIHPWMFIRAKEIDPDVQLFTNEYTIVYSQAQAKKYRQLLQYLETNGADVGGIGLQGHFMHSQVSPKAMEVGLSELTDLGNEIWFTEFDVENVDQHERAKALETFYRYAFSVPEVKGITMWGFWADAHWRGPNAALVDSDWTINAAGQAYFDLIDEWTTSFSDAFDSAANLAFRGFHGDYMITTTNPVDGQINHHLITVPEGASPLTATLIYDTTPNSLTIYGTSGDDQFEYDLEDKAKIIINGTPIVFSLPVDTTTIRFAGLGGTDHLKVKSKKANSEFRITDQLLTSIKEEFKVGYTSIETANFEASNLGSTVTMIDSAGDDSFESFHEESTLITPTITLTAKNFRYVFARATTSGNDTAILHDTAHIDRIHSDLNIVSIKWGARNRRAIGFEQTEVISTQGNDISGFQLTTDPKTINASPGSTVVTIGATTHTFTDVYRTTINGAIGNTDTILLTGSAGDETLKITQTISQFFNSEFRYYFKDVPNFATVGPDLGGTDSFTFRDSSDDDTLLVNGNVATISGPRYSHTLEFFDIIKVYSAAGGSDTAELVTPIGNVILLGNWQTP